MKTKQKEAIRKVLLSTQAHPSAEWIYEQVKKVIPNIALGTIYRNLRLMKEAGEVDLYIYNGQARYDGNTDGHHHFICSQCGQIIDLNEHLDSTIESRITKKTGLQIMNHHLEFRGLCLGCQKSISGTKINK